MFENEVQTRYAICGTGLLLGLVFVLAVSAIRNTCALYKAERIPR